jgi:periplasmic protein TonB
MRSNACGELYTPDEIARAAGVPVSRVNAALEGLDGYVPHADAVRLGRLLLGSSTGTTADAPPLFASAERPRSTPGAPLAISGGLHAGLLAIGLIAATRGVAATDPAVRLDPPRRPTANLVFLALPGPGGGGGGGGPLQRTPPPKAMREGRGALSSPLPKREPPPPIESAPPQHLPEPKRPALDAEPLPVLAAPVVAAPADSRSRAGALEQTTAKSDSRGPGKGGGVGSGAGTGIGEGDGAGLGPGTGGGTGGGPYRPGSGIDAPKLLREVKADYTEEARRRNLAGDVVLEIVVRSDGSVGDVKITQGLGGGLDQRAVQAVRQWQFAPGRRLGRPVDVVVEVAVEFTLR